MTPLWLSFTFDVNGELFTATYKIKLRRWEILSTRWVDPVLFPGELATANMETARELVARVASGRYAMAPRT